VAFAERVTLRRRLEDEVGNPALAMVSRLGLEALLEHAIATWTRAGEQFEDYADFERDGFRCPSGSAGGGSRARAARYRPA
jgi:hypothetical protein